MATYYVDWSAGGLNNGSSWTNAFTTFAAAVTAANAAGDIILVHCTHYDALAADTTYTFANDISVISVDRTNNNKLTPMSNIGSIGHISSNRGITLAGARKVYFNGITFRVSGGTADNITIANTDGAHYEFEDCFFFMANTANTCRFNIGPTALGNIYVRFLKSHFYTSDTGQAIVPRQGTIIFEDCYMSKYAANQGMLTYFVDDGTATTSEVTCIGCDFTNARAASDTRTLVGNMSGTARIFKFIQCKFLPSTTVLAAQTTHTNKASALVYVYDCSSDDTQGFFGYYDALGSCVSDTNTYMTDGSAGQSWRINTTANCNYNAPFRTPLIHAKISDFTPIAPYFEILEGSGLSSPYKNNQVWGEFFAKTTANSTDSTFYSDRMKPLNTPENHTTRNNNALSWTHPFGTTPWNGIVDSGATITLQEDGHISGRVAVAMPSTQLYVNPEIQLRYATTDDIVTEGLVLHLDAGNTVSYSGTGTTWTDISGYNNNVTLSNGPTYSSEYQGSIVFDGSNDYADFFAPNLGTTTTVEMWCRIKATTENVFFAFDRYLPEMFSGSFGYNTLNGDLYGISAATVTSLGFLNNWTHYVFEMRSDVAYTNNKLYVNGSLQTLSQLQGNENASERNFNNGNGRIAGWTVNGAARMPMDCGVFKVYNRALTQAEVTQNFNALRQRYRI